MCMPPLGRTTTPAHRAAWLQTALVAQLPSGALWDLGRPLTASTTAVELLPYDHPLARDVFWHSAAHVLGAALESVYGDRVRLCDGPPVYAPRQGLRAPLDDVSLRLDWTNTQCRERGGFFYEFALAPDTASGAPAGVTEGDLAQITEHAMAVIATRAPFERLDVDREVASSVPVLGCSNVCASHPSARVSSHRPRGPSSQRTSTSSIIWTGSRQTRPCRCTGAGPLWTCAAAHTSGTLARSV